MYFNCALTVDAVVFRDGGVVLIRRKNPPFEGMLALPGGFVDPDETAEAACVRELREETGLAVHQLHLIGVYSHPDRDPRGRVVSVAFVAEADGTVRAGDDAEAVSIVKNWREAELAFDHRNIIEAAVAAVGSD